MYTRKIGDMTFNLVFKEGGPTLQEIAEKNLRSILAQESASYGYGYSNFNGSGTSARQDLTVVRTNTS